MLLLVAVEVVGCRWVLVLLVVVLGKGIVLFDAVAVVREGSLGRGGMVEDDDSFVGPDFLG